MWTPARIAQLQKLWTDGLSASECARALGDCTRNAVIGKVHRMGLAGRAACRQAQPRLAKPRRAPPANLPSAVAARPVGPVLELVGLATLPTLSKHTCRWPIGDPEAQDFTFCGRTKERGAYCADHAARAYRPDKTDVMRLARFA